ncbi:MAG: hypothetical protein WC347_01040 [Smithellaceae bacterium]|jgi:hypothetical protein
MDIKSIQPTADITFAMEDEQLGTLSLTVGFLAQDDVADYIEAGEKKKLSKLIREMLIDAVKGWDLKSNGKPVPCTDEEKKKHLPIILGLKIKVENEEGKKRMLFDDVLGRALLEFAGNEKNFLKN